MSRFFIDTHELVKELIGSGMEEKMAEALVKAIADSRNYSLSALATKVDVLEVKIAVEKIARHLSIKI